MAYNPHDNAVPREDHGYSPHLSRRLPQKPPEEVWLLMTEEQRLSYLSWVRLYRDQLLDEDRNSKRRANGY